MSSLPANGSLKGTVQIQPGTILELTLDKGSRPRRARYDHFREVSIHLKSQGRHLHLLQTTDDQVIFFADDLDHLVILGKTAAHAEIIWWAGGVSRVSIDQVLWTDDMEAPHRHCPFDARNVPKGPQSDGYHAMRKGVEGAAWAETKGSASLSSTSDDETNVSFPSCPTM